MNAIQTREHRTFLDLIEVSSHREHGPWEQPIYTQEQRLGECLLLLCGRDPSAASAVIQILEKNKLSNGGQILQHRLNLMHPKHQMGLPILGDSDA